MKHKRLTRREFLQAGAVATMSTAATSLFSTVGCSVPVEKTAVVSIARVKNENIPYAVEEAIDLLGGMETIAAGKEQIMLKPNLVAESPRFTTKPEVVQTLAQLMQKSGKDVLIGEGSAAAGNFNFIGGETYHTGKPSILDAMQTFIFDRLGYTEMARSLGVPLINLHTGEMVDISVPNGLAYEQLTLHQSLAGIDLLCSVPMMKTHTLATVTLGMKNLIGLYPGAVYHSVRSRVHEHCARAGSPGVAYEIVDMVRANKLGLTVVDGSMAMEGDGPTGGEVVKMDVIIAGTNPVATDMVSASVMGFAPEDVPTFSVAHEAGLGPQHLNQIEIRGAPIRQVRRRLKRPEVVPWQKISHSWGVKEL